MFVGTEVMVFIVSFFLYIVQKHNVYLEDSFIHLLKILIFDNQFKENI